MQISANKVVAIDYTLTDQKGEVLDTSQGREPLIYLHGHGSIIPGLETALEGKNAGEQFTVTVAPEKAYGVKDEAMIQSVPRSSFAGIANIAPGMRFEARSPEGVRIVTVLAVDEETVRIDANHPLAGMHLMFEVKIVEVREAQPEELAHGHVHGPGGREH